MAGTVLPKCGLVIYRDGWFESYKLSHDFLAGSWPNCNENFWLTFGSDEIITSMFPTLSKVAKKLKVICKANNHEHNRDQNFHFVGRTKFTKRIFGGSACPHALWKTLHFNTTFY